MKNFKNILTLLIAICLIGGLVGCGNWIKEESIQRAYNLCENNGGIKHLQIFYDDTLVCKNGAEFERNAWFAN